jgi:hypothetical protein
MLPMMVVGAVFNFLTMTGLAPGPDQITPLLVGRVVEYDDHDPERKRKGRQEWFADGTTWLSHMGLFMNGTREWRVIGRLYCSTLPESDDLDCFRVVTWDNGRRIRFSPVPKQWSDLIIDLRGSWIGTFVDQTGRR